VIVGGGMRQEQAERKTFASGGSSVEERSWVMFLGSACSAWLRLLHAWV
jgi:hypothetical protein